MSQDDNTSPAGIVEEAPAPECEQTVPPAPANPEPTTRLNAGAPDMFAVGVRVLRMAPAWLLTMTVGCTALVLLLGWMNAGVTTTAVAQPSALNDARSSRAASAANAARPAAVHQAEPTTPAGAPNNATSSADNKPAPAAVQPTAPAPAAPAAEKSNATAAPSKEGEKAQAESPAPGDDGGATFTVQVGSFNNQSEANERVSSLRAAGFEARAVAVEIQGRGTWYRVQVGRFADRGEGAKTVASLRAKGTAGAIVVPAQN
jgi:cell division septation protein DedD